MMYTTHDGHGKTKVFFQLEKPNLFYYRGLQYKHPSRFAHLGSFIQQHLKQSINAEMLDIYLSNVSPRLTKSSILRKLFCQFLPLLSAYLLYVKNDSFLAQYTFTKKKKNTQKNSIFNTLLQMSAHLFTDYFSFSGYIVKSMGLEI